MCFFVKNAIQVNNKKGIHSIIELVGPHVNSMSSNVSMRCLDSNKQLPWYGLQSAYTLWLPSTALQEDLFLLVHHIVLVTSRDIPCRKLNANRGPPCYWLVAAKGPIYHKRSVLNIPPVGNKCLKGLTPLVLVTLKLFTFIFKGLVILSVLIISSNSSPLMSASHYSCKK